MRRVAQLCWMYLLFATGVLWLCKWRLSRQRATIVLTLHRVLSEPEYSKTSSPYGMVLRTATFSSLMRYVGRKCELADVSNGWLDRGCRPGRVRIAVTFDDGWKDTAQEAFPIACEHRAPLTVFICPALQDRAFPFWPERAVSWWTRARSESSGKEYPSAFPSAAAFVQHLKSLSPAERTSLLAGSGELSADELRREPCNRTLDWEQTRALSRRGVTFGSHTSTHPLLPQLSQAEVARELVESSEKIGQELDKRPFLFAYPNGDWTPDVQEQVRRAGYRLAFSTKPGAWCKDTDPLLIPRINLYEEKVKGPFPGFSRIAFEYSVFWKALRSGPASRAACDRRIGEIAPSPFRQEPAPAVESQP